MKSAFPHRFLQESCAFGGEVISEWRCFNGLIFFLSSQIATRAWLSVRDAQMYTAGQNLARVKDAIELEINHDY